MNKRLAGWAFVLLVLVLLGVEGVLAGSVIVRVGSVEAALGSSVEVPIEGQGASDIGAMHLELLYDASVLTPETVTSGPLVGNNAMMEFNTSAPGRLVIGLITLDSMNGDGTIATVHLKVIGQAGQTSALTLEHCSAWEGPTHLDVLVTTEPGQVTVRTAQGTWTLPGLALSAGVLLLGVGISLWLWRKRARRKELQR